MAKIPGNFIIGEKDANGKLIRPWYGLNTATKDLRALKAGETYSANNWITGRDQDNIQLRRGTALLGQTRRNIAGAHVSGIGVGVLSNGTQQLFYSYNQSLMYYNNATQDTAEVSSVNILGAAATNDDVVFMPYNNLAGSMMYITSPNSSTYKVPVANPANPFDLVPSASNASLKNSKFGSAKIDQGRIIGVQRFGVDPSQSDNTGLYLSRVDQQTSIVHDMVYPILVSATAHTTGGAMNDGTYYYVITGVDLAGHETLKSNEVSAVISGGGGSGSITLVWNKIAGLGALTSYSGFKIYRSGSAGSYGTNSFIAEVTNSGSYTFTDTFTTAGTGQPPSTSVIVKLSLVGTGDGTTKTFTQNSPLCVAPLTAFGVQITDGNEVFNDDKNGNLIGSLGGTGTVNYSPNATVGFTVNFKTAPLNGAPISISFYTEDATNAGIADFTQNSGDTTGTYAQVFRQDDGGGTAMLPTAFQGIFYVFHLLRTWNFSISVSSAGDSFENEPYWSQIGIPYPRAAFETGDGVLYLDNTVPTNPKFSILEIPPNSTNLTVVPVAQSLDLDLSGFLFQKCVVTRWDEYNIFSCQGYTGNNLNNYNSVTFVQNITSNVWNQLDYTPSCLAQFNGTLVQGDALSPNVFTLFSGFDDDGQIINNSWNTGYEGFGLTGLKKVGYIHCQGLINRPQSLALYYSLDFGPYVPVTQNGKQFIIKGTGPYVNNSVNVGVGTYTIGTQTIGGGQVTANPFEVDIRVRTDKFEYISLMLVATGIGFLQVNQLGYKDIRYIRQRTLAAYDQGISGN